MTQAAYYEILFFFCLGYIGIIFENFLKLNKSAVALTMAAGCWLIYYAHGIGGDYKPEILPDQISTVAQIIFFLLAVMVIVELIDSHHGFKIFTDILYVSSRKKMLWFLIGISFFMSAVLDNLTSMIVMASLLRKLVREKHDRWILGSIVVIAVNAGGAWTPIGDVTTTLLWINNKITTWETIKALFLPSVVCTAVAGLLALFYLRKEREKQTNIGHKPMEPGAKKVLIMGFLALILIPFWKGLFNLPPFLGALIGVGILWLATDFMHHRYGEERVHLRVIHILKKIDTSGILFFLGILLAINALEAIGALNDLADWLNRWISDQKIIAILIGLISSVIDNVPLVAATMGMYDSPTDSALWQLIAYAAGTGGSILIIGSAAGVAFMGMEKIDFLWYFRHISWIALISYFAGVVVYFLMYPVLYK